MEGLILDFDDTLVRMTPERWEVFELALLSFGADQQSIHAMNQIRGAPLGTLVEVAAPTVKLADFLSFYSNMLTADRIEICPGAPELLDWAREASVRTVVLSASSHLLIERDLQLANLGDKVEAILGFEDVPAPKPDPAAVRAALRAKPLREIPPDRILMIGDSLADASAADGQVDFVAVLSGSTNRVAFESAGISPHAVVDSLHELVGRLKSVNGYAC